MHALNLDKATAVVAHFFCEWAELRSGRHPAGGAGSRPEEGADHLTHAPPCPRQPLPAATSTHPGGVRGHHRAALQRPQSAVGGSEFGPTLPPGGVVTLLLSFMVHWCPADGAFEDAAEGCQVQQEDTEPAASWRHLVRGSGIILVTKT